MDYFGIKLLFFVLLSRPLLVLLHELGHAIPAMLMTGERVSVYIGSYGDPKKSLRFRMGLLEVWFRYNPFLLVSGLTVPSAKDIPLNKQIIYTATGPLGSFVFIAAVCYLTFMYDVHDLVRLMLVILVGWSVLDLLVSLIPRATPTRLHDGTVTYNDGYLLKQLFAYRRFDEAAYAKAADLYTAQRFDEAAKAYTDMLRAGLKDEDIYRVAIACFIQIKDYQQAREVSEEFKVHGTMNAEDYLSAGVCYAQLEQLDRAMEFFDKSLELDQSNTNALVNKGFALSLLDKYQEAILLFNNAIEIDDSIAYAYSNRGYAKIKIGKVEEGLEDIQYALELDENDAYGHRNLGIYSLDRGEYSAAFECFRKAKELNSATHMIDALIDQALNHQATTSYTQRTAPHT